MSRRVLFVSQVVAAVLVVGLGLLATSCGGGSGSNLTQPATGNVQIKMGDAPADSVLAFELTITRIDLTPQGGSPVTVLSHPRDIELAHLSGTVETLALTKVAPGTYTGASISVSKVEVTYIPTGTTTPVHKEFTLNATVNVSFTPAVTIGAGAMVLNFDVNLAQSLTFDASGNVTAINPVFAVSTSAIAPKDQQKEEDGEMEDFVGMVTTLTPASGNAPASFVVTPQSSGDPRTFTVDANTKFDDGLTQFSDLKLNMMVKVDAVTQTDASLLAKEVELLEDHDGTEVEGIVIDTSGSPVTTITLMPQEGAGSNFSNTSVGSNVTVNVANAVFKDPLTDSDHSELLRNLPFTAKFDNTTIAKGQSVEVDTTAAVTPNATIGANKVHLRKQALTGTVAAAPAGSNATISLLLDADSAFVKLTGVSSINVFKVPKTDMQVSALTPGTKVRVRGLLFFNGTSYQFVAWRIGQP